LNAAKVTVPDGRELAYEQVGDREGSPVFVLHGTPGSRLTSLRQISSRVAEAGLRVITYDRPGYGESTRHPGRAVVDCVGDVAAIADELGLERFSVSGGSGGGPHALAVGARLPGRVVGVLCDVAGAPFDAPDLDWFEGMDPANVREFRLALEGEDILTRDLRRESEKILDGLADGDPTAILSEIDLPAADRAVLQDEQLCRGLSQSVSEALRQGVSGWVDDDLALMTRWGFDLEELEVPVEIRYGTRDVLVPAAHGAWLAAHVPNATVTVDHDAGHLIGPTEHLARLRGLVTA
jgi:pimeloyl-ACP methyl ester carboxylesterase